jgi:hypothetical protein
VPDEKKMAGNSIYLIDNNTKNSYNTRMSKNTAQKVIIFFICADNEQLRVCEADSESTGNYTHLVNILFNSTIREII